MKCFAYHGFWSHLKRLFYRLTRVYQKGLWQPTCELNLYRMLQECRQTVRLDRRFPLVVPAWDLWLTLNYWSGSFFLTAQRLMKRQISSRSSRVCCEPSHNCQFLIFVLGQSFAAWLSDKQAKHNLFCFATLYRSCVFIFLTFWQFQIRWSALQSKNFDLILSLSVFELKTDWKLTLDFSENQTFFQFWGWSIEFGKWRTSSEVLHAFDILPAAIYWIESDLVRASTELANQ